MHKQNRKPCKAIEGLTKYNAAFKKAVKPCLVNNSEKYCSYCDAYMGDIDNLLIEHFKGKTKFPELEAEYSNLYAACFACNNRKVKTNYSTIEPLRPDINEYNFDDFFRIDYENGKIETLDENDSIAAETIRFLNLNRIQLKNARKDFIREWRETKSRPRKSYRFIYF